MTPQTQQQPLGQEAAVAVLQTTTRHLEERVTELVKSNSDGMSAIVEKLDEIQKQGAIIASMAAEQRSHSEGLARAFGEIKAVETLVKSEIARVEQKCDTNAAAITKQEGSTQFAKGGLWVLTGVAALILGVLVWALNPVLQTPREIQEIKLQLERMKTTP
jgi:hypothetical protein